MREGSFQEDMADVANESTAGTAGGERAAVLALRTDGEESELRNAAGTGSTPLLSKTVVRGGQMCIRDRPRGMRLRRRAAAYAVPVRLA